MKSMPGSIDLKYSPSDVLNKVRCEFAAETDLGTALDRILLILFEKIGVKDGGIIVLNEHNLVMQSVSATRGGQLTILFNQNNFLEENELANWIINNRHGVIIQDTTLDARWNQTSMSSNQNSDPKSVICAPILVHKTVIGFIILIKTLPGFFLQEHLDLLEGIADQAAIAILNTRLSATMQRRMLVEKAWDKCAQAFSTPGNYEDKIRIVLDQISEALRTSFVSLCLLEKLSTGLKIFAVHSSTQLSLLGRRIPVGEGIIGWVAQCGQGVMIPDVSRDPRFQIKLDPVIDFGNTPQAFVCAPIRTDNQVYGVISASVLLPDLFDAADLSFLQGIATMAGLAIRQGQFRLISGKFEQFPSIPNDHPDCIELDRLREDLTEMVYHDLRSPLSNVTSSLEALSKIVSGDQAVDSLLRIAIQSTEHVQRLTNSLLEINQLEVGQQLGVRTMTSVKNLLEYSTSSINLLAKDKNIQILVEKMSNEDELWVDEDMIRRVVINLLENALKFSPSKGKIWVGAKRINDKMLFWLKDSGPGISSANQERIFDKFFCLQTQEKSRGLGLGLAYCRLAIQAHGGDIWVESQPGEGACFKFTLPLISKENSKAVALPGGISQLDE